jgi:hypothetical protein
MSSMRSALERSWKSQLALDCDIAAAAEWKRYVGIIAHDGVPGNPNAGDFHLVHIAERANEDDAPEENAIPLT